MTRLTQICVLFVAILWCEQALSSPIFESINIDRKLNIEFKPLKFRPITFIKEKWGPFGKFIKKHTIERRDLDEMNTIDSKVEDIKPVEDRLIPVFEKEEPIMGPVPVYRSPVQAVVVESVPPPVSKLNTDISGAIPVNTIAAPVPSYRPPVQAVVVESNPPPISKLNTDISEAIPVNPMPVSPNPMSAIPVSPIPVGPFFTPVRTPEITHLESLGAVPIVRSPIEGPLLVPVTTKVPQPVVPPSSPPPPPPPANVGVPPGSRFGAFARFFGEILSEIVNRLIARARLSFGQFTNQPAAVQ